MRTESRAAIGIIEAETPEQFECGRRLFQEYAEELDIDLCFQNFAAELEALPSIYSPPSGALLLAVGKDGLLGCVALRRLREQTCEMKRLYVRERARGRGLGRRLAEAVLEKGRALGYERMVLDTLESMGPARALYRALGFRPTSPYTGEATPGVTYMALDLD